MKANNKKQLNIIKPVIMLLFLFVVVLGFGGCGVEEEVVDVVEGEEKEIDISSWKMYRNEEYGFEIKYPNNWINNRSVDGGTISLIPFFDEKKYEKKCITKNNLAISCVEHGKIFEISIKMEEDKMLQKNNIKKYNNDQIEGSIYEELVETSDFSFMPFESNKLLVFESKIDDRYLKLKMVYEDNSDRWIFNQILSNLIINI